jgi:hypothetical protein
MTKICQKEYCDKEAIKRGKYCIDHCTTRKRSENLYDDSKTDEEILVQVRRNIQRQRIEEDIQRIENERLAEIRRMEMIRKEEERKMNEIRYAEERLLREEQENEYNEACRQDLEKINRERELEQINREKELEQINREKDLERQQIEDAQKFDISMREKVRLNNERVNDEYYKIKFVFKNLGNLSMISTFSKDDCFERVFNFIDSFFYESSINFPSEGYELISYPNITLSELDHSKIKISEKFDHRNIQLTFKEIEK